MQKKFTIIDTDRLLNDLIEEQILTVFKKNFNIKFLKNYNINSLDEFEEIDLIIVNFMFVKDIYNILADLEKEKKTKIIIMFDHGVDRSQLKKFSNYNFVVKPFKLKQLIDIIKDCFISYETLQKNITITHNLFFRPETNSCRLLEEPPKPPSISKCKTFIKKIYIK